MSMYVSVCMGVFCVSVCVFSKLLRVEAEKSLKTEGCCYSERETGCKGGQTAEHRSQMCRPEPAGMAAPAASRTPGTSEGQRPRWLREWKCGAPASLATGLKAPTK